MSQWLQDSIDKGLIKLFDFNQFRDPKVLARGAFGEVSRAYWISGEKTVALKTLYNSPELESDKSLNEFVNEFQLIRSVDFHDNVIRFFGLSLDATSNRYFMVLQYADGGNLRDYLRKNRENLSWEDKIRMGKEISSGLKCIHERNIVHRDLHSKNILVHEKRMMITDFGLSKSGQANSNSAVVGMAGYVEPQCFINPKYKRDKKSDIYSLGVLLWEITSGVPPFKDLEMLEIIKEVGGGKRETPVDGTPKDYWKIYDSAWNQEPSKRPEIEQIRGDLDNINLLSVLDSNYLANRKRQSLTSASQGNAQYNNNHPPPQRPLVDNGVGVGGGGGRNNNVYQNQPYNVQEYPQQHLDKNKVYNVQEYPPLQGPDTNNKVYNVQEYGLNKAVPYELPQNPRIPRHTPAPSVPSFSSARKGNGQVVQRASSIPTEIYKSKDNSYPSVTQNNPALITPQPPTNYTIPPSQNDVYNQNWHPAYGHNQQQAGMQQPMTNPYHNNNPYPTQPPPQSQLQHYVQNNNPPTSLTSQQQQNYPNSPSFVFNNSQQPYSNDLVYSHNASNYDPQGGYSSMNSQATYEYSQQHHNYAPQSHLPPNNSGYQPVYPISSGQQVPREKIDQTKYIGMKSCSDILDKYIEGSRSLKGFVEPKECDAAIHVGAGDAMGLMYHLDSGDNVNRGYDYYSYDYVGVSEPLIHIASACCKGKKLISVLRTLKERNADFRVKNKYKKTALHRIFDNKALRKKLKEKEEVETYVRYVTEAIEILCENHCPINARDKSDQTVLSNFLTEEHNKPDSQQDRQDRQPIIKTLLDLGANPNLSCVVRKVFDAPTALFLAIEYDWPTDVIELMMKKGADARRLNKERKNILCLALQKNRSNLAEWLLDNIYSLSEHSSIKEAKSYDKSGTLKKWKGILGRHYDSKRKSAKEKNIENYLPETGLDDEEIDEEQPWFVEEIKKKYVKLETSKEVDGC